MYCTVSSSQRLNSKTSLISVDIFVLDRQRHTHTENFSYPQSFQPLQTSNKTCITYLNRSQKIYYISVIYVPDRHHNKPRALCGFGKWKISTTAKVESGLKMHEHIPCSSSPEAVESGRASRTEQERGAGPFSVQSFNQCSL